MNFDKNNLIELVNKSYIPFLLILIIIIQIYNNYSVSERLEKLENVYFNVEQKIWNLQTVLWIDIGPITSIIPTNIGKWILNPAEPPKAMLPIKPDNVIDMVYLEKWTKEQDNFYPIWKKIVYAVSDDIFTVWSLYSNKLLKMWRQVTNLKAPNTTKWQKTSILSFKATNWQSNISVEFFDKYENYNKKAWSFVKLIIEN